MGLKIYNFCCDQGHLFEGWYRSDDAWRADVAEAQLACPVCGSTRIEKRPSAPNFGRVSGTTRTEVDRDVAGRRAAEMKAAQARVMSALREVASQAEDVGDAFPDTVRAIHDGRTPHRLVRGTCSNAVADELREEGIPVMALPDAACKPLN